jgi:ribosomal protein S18 acetylase RimI-like enzyme
MIRPALPTELPAVGDLRVAAYQADGYLSPSSSYAPRLRALGTQADGTVLVAIRDNGELAGTIMLLPWPHTGELVRSPGDAEIRALAVAPEARGQGLGRKLLLALLDLAAEQQVRNLLLASLPAMRAAHHLYEQHGFTRMPERDWTPEGGSGLLLVYGMRLPAENLGQDSALTKAPGLGSDPL